jgi:hypothetical protein
VLYDMITQLENDHRHTTDNTVDEHRRAPTTPPTTPSTSPAAEHRQNPYCCPPMQS